MQEPAIGGAVGAASGATGPAWGAGIIADMGKLKQDAAQMKDAADSGDLEVNESGGAAILAWIHDMQDFVGYQVQQLGHLEQKPKMGTSYGAQVMAPFMQQVAVDEQGILPVLKEFQTVLDDAESSIKKAMDSYQRTDADNAGQFPT